MSPAALARCTIACCVVMASLYPAGAATVLAQARSVKQVLSGGAAVTSGATHRLVGTVGQPIIATPRGETHRASFGFWFSSENISTSIIRLPSAVPAAPELEANHPNPARDATTLRFSLPVPGAVRLVVADASGRTVRSLVEGTMDAGRYSMDVSLHGLSPGMYFFHLTVSGLHTSRKFLRIP